LIFEWNPAGILLDFRIKWKVIEREPDKQAPMKKYINLVIY